MYNVSASSTWGSDIMYKFLFYIPINCVGDSLTQYIVVYGVILNSNISFPEIT